MSHGYTLHFVHHRLIVACGSAKFFMAIKSFMIFCYATPFNITYWVCITILVLDTYDYLLHS
uniref:Uncharacterized protein n=1 Tax=Rhizophora mucronata TaxID=61149 RepID=A0A2P2NG12_RHIMU